MMMYISARKVTTKSTILQICGTKRDSCNAFLTYAGNESASVEREFQLAYQFANVCVLLLHHLEHLGCAI